MKTKEILIILLLISALAFTEWNRLKINRLEAVLESHQKLLGAHQEVLMSLSVAGIMEEEKLELEQQREKLELGHQDDTLEFLQETSPQLILEE